MTFAIKFFGHSFRLCVHPGIIPCRHIFNAGNSKVDVVEAFRNVMRNVPQSVVVVTTAVHNQEFGSWIKRGVTCSSFTSISMKPPVISFAISKKSRMHSLMMDADHFAVHVLANNQVAYGLHFSKSLKNDEVDQFVNVPHEMDELGLPILRDCTSVVRCHAHSVHTIGDHHVWYGEVCHAYANQLVPVPLLYFAKSFRCIGDEIFLKAFEDATLPFQDWTHEAHIRMSWNYLREFHRLEAIERIKSGIRYYNSQNLDRISRGYHETVTMFYITLIADVMAAEPCCNNFEEFLVKHPWIMKRDLLFEYYSDQLINQARTKTQFVLPDKKPLSSPR